MSSKANPVAVARRSSMESFLDEYQLVRLVMVSGGLVLMVALAFLGGWVPNVIQIAVVLLVVAGHATWCLVRGIRAPKSMLALDLTLFGWVMTLIADSPAITTASLAFLVLLVVLFADGLWTFAFLAYIAVWYGLSHFGFAGFSAESWSTYLPVMFTVGGLAAVMWRIKAWLGRLDANRSQMMGTVSHELKNNLTGMIGMTELVGSEDLTLVEVKELVGMAHSQAVDAAEIVEDLLTA
ncbi:MAG TPA: histidine kinase dimerization/phospho-acceptor domain-containing protein, partial [Acidimicrobiia bacterium]|nr:histidine kinase dimerization/phospho-acceptor domain-containing protein [Acidimicrobiia bacterium]